MKKNGFIFIETIITVVVLSTSLLLLYNFYNNSILNEKERLYYDDVSYYYKNNIIKKFLYQYSNLDAVKNCGFDNNTYIITIGPSYDILFSDDNEKYRSVLQEIYNLYHIDQVLLVKKEFIEECYEVSESKCLNSFENVSYEMRDYLLSLNDTNSNYYLVIMYQEKVNDDNEVEKCNKYCDNLNDPECINGLTRNCKTNYAVIGV